MHVEALDPTTADRDAWQSLADGAADPNPFFEPGFVLPAVRHLGGDGVRLLVARGADGAWLGAMPAVSATRWRSMPARVRGSWIHPYAFLGAPLVAPGAEDVLPALVGALRRGVAFAPLELLPTDGSAAAAARQAASAVVWHDYERAALRRRPVDDYEHTNLSAKHRRELRRQRRLLGEQVGEVDVVDDPGAADALLELETEGWKGRAGSAMGTAGAAPFFREVCDAFAARGRLQLLLLRAGGRTIAAKANLLAGPGVFCFKIAFDESLARFSPGVQLELENIRAFHARPELAWMDSCADPANAMINRLWPDRRALTSLLVPGAGMLGRAGHLQVRIGLALRNRNTKGTRHE